MVYAHGKVLPTTPGKKPYGPHPLSPCPSQADPLAHGSTSSAISTLTTIPFARFPSSSQEDGKLWIEENNRKGDQPFVQSTAFFRNTLSVCLIHPSINLLPSSASAPSVQRRPVESIRKFLYGSYCPCFFSDLLTSVGVALECIGKRGNEILCLVEVDSRHPEWAKTNNPPSC